MSGVVKGDVMKVGLAMCGVVRRGVVWSGEMSTFHDFSVEISTFQDLPLKFVIFTDLCCSSLRFCSERLGFCHKPVVANSDGPTDLLRSQFRTKSCQPC